MASPFPDINEAIKRASQQISTPPSRASAGSGAAAVNLNISQEMTRLIYLLLLFIFSFSVIHAENVRVIIPTNKSTNYALYSAETGVFLRLDTRDGTIQAIVPSNSKKNRVLNSQPLVSNNDSGRFELYPTDNIWEWLLFDNVTGEMWTLKWSSRHNILSKISIVEKQDVE
ncbi:MAG: hypothetical protein K2M59_05535 [Muribaculaceae bacterium]|nr:hypothetical protein [Muribaculaceae bacterium]